MIRLLFNIFGIILSLFSSEVVFCQTDSSGLFQKDTLPNSTLLNVNHQNKNIIYGIASYYGDKFEGRKTASGQIFSQQKWTAACNRLPLGTRIKVTNIRNGKSVEVVVNDRLHPKMKRVVDLTKIAAKKLGFLDHGLTKVKVEVIGVAKTKKK